MPVNVEDVAARAGVSVSTVSRALRDLPSVAQHTRERVQRIALELGYVSSPSASRLATGKTCSIGVVVPLMHRWFFGQVIAGISAVLREAGYDLLLFEVGDVEGRNRFFDRPTLRGRVDAVIVIDLPLEEAELATLRALDVPVATLGTRFEGFHSVGIDNLQAASTAVRHLINLGHERIGLISQENRVNAPMPFPDSRDRGYRGTLEEHGIEHDPRLECHAPFGVEGGTEAMTRLLSVPHPPTAVFAEFDEMAFGAIRAVRRAGLRVPEDVSVIGFDDHQMSELLGLTTIRQPVREQGCQAALLLLDALESAASTQDTTGDQTSAITMPTSLVIRDSTAPPRKGRVFGGADHDEPPHPLIK